MGRSFQTAVTRTSSPTMELTATLPEDPTKVRTTMVRPSTPRNCSETILIPSTLVNMLVKTELTINAPNAMVSLLLSVKPQQAMRLVTMLKMLALRRSVVKWKAPTESTRFTLDALPSRPPRLNSQRTSTVQARSLNFATNVADITSTTPETTHHQVYLL